MFPTILNSEWVLVKKDFEIQRYDVVAIADGTNGRLVKRIVGMPNDRVEINNGYIYINDKKIKDSFGINFFSLVGNTKILKTTIMGPLLR